MEQIVDIRSVSDIMQFYKAGTPKHPLITVLDLTSVDRSEPISGAYYHNHLYTISCKTFEGALQYGHSSYDFKDGTLMLTAPGQLIRPSQELNVDSGWLLCFHPELITGSELERKIGQYSFFHYEVHEALHLSEAEKDILFSTVSLIKNEYEQRVDTHTSNVLIDQMQLLLSYCNRFYDRQFLTRKNTGQETVLKFEKLLKDYFNLLQYDGMPDVKFFSEQLNLSTYYLSDLLSKYTGKSTIEHIHLEVISHAKNLLKHNDIPISEIAYKLGFNYPSHFTQLFKNKTGLSPKAFRNLN